MSSPDVVEPRGFAALRGRFPWPDAPVYPDAPLVGRRVDGHPLVEHAIRNLTTPNPVVMEIGAEFGSSTRHWLGIDGTFVVSVDPWPDDYGFRGFPELAHLRGKERAMYDVFQSLNHDHRDRLVAVRAYSPAGPKAVYDAGVHVDVVYIDGDHRFEPVLRDLAITTTLFPDAVVAGDDWGFSSPAGRYEGMRFPVRAAVMRWARLHDVAVRVEQNTWLLDPSHPYNLDRLPPVIGTAQITPRLDKRLTAIEAEQRRIARSLAARPSRRVLRAIRSLTRGSDQ